MQAVKHTHQLLVAFVVAVAAALCLSVAPSAQAYATNNSWYDSAASSFAGGTGTSTDPYQIATAEQLAYLSKVVSQSSTQSTYNTSAKYYKLTADITLNASAVSSTQVSTSTPGTDGVSNYSGSDTLREWFPIGGGSTSYSFKGHFDGDNKTISNIFYNESNGSYSSGNSVRNNVGLFGKVEVGAEVKNVKLSGGYFGAQRSVGGICGKSWGSIINCHNVGVYVYSTDSKGVGGIVGANWVDTTIAPVVDTCSNTGTVVSSYTSGAAGGIAGENEGVVRNSWNNGTVKSPRNAGGIVGSNKNVRNKQTPDHTGEVGGSVNSSIMNCFNGSDAAIIGGYAGGLAGYQACEAQCGYNMGTISAYPGSGSSYVGELFGQLSSTATNDYLFYYEDETAVGTGTLSGSNCNTFTDATVLLGYLNGWVGTTNTVYYRWVIDSAQNSGWPIHDTASLYVAA